ncbi:hypothetical protein ETAA8_06670 [Anatilimnocola aggregata]|uniref:SF3 helicase domain-containing protein n=1 Tax=Anatilimnocola aggregata TaxID=2528021 RepID=A0A517Y5T2_9BACT|nr:hypothetical protein [Anatilimnocola aggregata]QDU25597.1 hypothetical protein ETAA8_06670 [Anatilimnocola aggregata]
MVYSSKVAEIACKFDDARQTGPTQWEAKCPVHEDCKSSLCIGELDAYPGAAGIHCQAGCDVTAVLQSRGLTYNDLFPERSKPKANGKPKTKRKLVAAYVYQDEQGNPLFRKLRYDPKAFLLEHWNGKAWVSGMEGVRRVLYNLPTILAAEPDEFIVGAEGEKDCDNLAALGFRATTNFDGASKNIAKPKWLEEYNSALVGKHFVWFADNDSPGESHAEAIAASVHAAGAASVRIVQFRGLQPGGDVSDVIAQGATGDDLYGIILATPKWAPNGETASKQTAENSSNTKRDRPIARIWNTLIEYGEDEDGNECKTTVPLTMTEVKELIRKETDDFPRRTGNALFVHDPKHGISWLEKPAAMFGWMADKVGIVEWKQCAGAVTKDELFHEHRRSARNYAAVEVLPHEPMRQDHYYACGVIEPGNGEHLQLLLDRFNPETDIDRDLIQAMLMTILWGGAGGMRPVFVITTGDGPGAGKTTLVRMAAQIFGGYLSFDRGEQVADIKTRLLSSDALTKRIALIDNVKSTKWSWGEFEGLITSSTISGHRMYMGEGSRPNTITWCLTLNGANLSTDMGQRAVVIVIKKPRNTGTWEEDTRRFIEEHRLKILADLIGVLRSEPHRFERFTRWADWEASVLARVPNPVVAQAAIADRQATVDAEQEEHQLLEEFISDELRRLGYDTEHERIFIPTKIIVQWANRAAHENSSPTAVSRKLRQLVKEEKFLSLKENTDKRNGRGFIWAGLGSFGRPTITDLEQRIFQKRNYAGVNEETEGGSF